MTTLTSHKYYQKKSLIFAKKKKLLSFGQAKRKNSAKYDKVWGRKCKTSQSIIHTWRKTATRNTLNGNGSGKERNRGAYLEQRNSAYGSQTRKLEVVSERHCFSSIG